MDVFCVGMYRAGSTWQYNVACDLVERRGESERLGFVHGHLYEPPAPGSRGSYRVLKAHDGHRRLAEALHEGRARALYSHRDLRDVAFSLMHKCKIDFDEVAKPGGLLESCLENDRFWSAQPDVLHQRYEAMIAEPVAAVLAIADHLGLVPEAGEARAIAAENSPRSNLERTEALARRLRDDGLDLDAPENALRFDPKTLLHWNHLRSGRAGAWRDEATPAQRERLAALCGDWLIRRGYEPNDAWAWDAEPALR